MIKKGCFSSRRKTDITYTKKQIERVLNPDAARKKRAIRVNRLIDEVETVLCETHRCDCLDCEPVYKALRKALSLCLKRD